MTNSGLGYIVGPLIGSLLYGVSLLPFDLLYRFLESRIIRVYDIRVVDCKALMINISVGAGYS